MRKGWLAILALAVAALMEPTAHAIPVTFITIPGSDSDGPLAAKIQFIPLAGQIKIIVTNTETGTFAKGQAISDFSFSVSGINTPTAFTELSGRDDPSTSIGSGPLPLPLRQSRELCCRSASDSCLSHL